MANLFVRDSRLTLAGTLVLPIAYGGTSNRLVVDSSTSLADFVSMFENQCTQRGPFQKMLLHAHGRTLTGQIELEFCREGLRRSNVGLLSGLRGKVRHIKLMSCEAASPDHGGDEFCGALAIATAAYVTASQAVQVITEGSTDRWEGTVITYDPTTGGRLSARFFPEDPDVTGANNIVY